MELVQAVALYKDVLDLILVFLYNIHSHWVKRRTGGVDLKIIIAVDTGYLFDYVSLDGNVLCRSPRGNYNVKGIAAELDLEAEARQGFYDSVVVDLDTGVAVNKSLVKGELDRVVLKSVLVSESRYDLYSAVILLEQEQESRNGNNGHLGIEALFVAHRRIRAVRKPYR